VYGDVYIPTLTKSSPTGGSASGYVNQTLSFSVEATDSGGNLSKIEFYVNNTLASTKSFSGTIYYGAATYNKAFTASGTNNVSVLARDASGNLSSWVGWSVTVTNRTPAATRNSPSSSSVTIAKGSNQTFSVSGTDADGNLRGAEWYRDGNYVGLTTLSGSSGTTSHTESFPNTGTYTVGAHVHDLEFAYAPLISWTVTVTCPAPVGFSLTSPSNGAVLSGNSSVALSWGQSSGAVTYEVYFGTSTSP